MTELDCRTCGACCAAESWSRPEDGYVALEPKDVRRLPSHPLRNLLIVETGRYKPTMGEEVVEHSLRTRRNKQGLPACVALTGEVGRRVSCSIYEVRPDACRRFKRGSMECHEARVTEGLEAKGKSM